MLPTYSSLIPNIFFYIFIECPVSTFIFLHVLGSVIFLNLLIGKYDIYNCVRKNELFSTGNGNRTSVSRDSQKVFCFMTTSRYLSALASDLIELVMINGRLVGQLQLLNFL